MSGTMAALSGAAYALLFGYAGDLCISQYSIFLCSGFAWWSRNGIRAIHSTLFMFYLIDLSSSFTTAYMP